MVTTWVYNWTDTTGRLVDVLFSEGQIGRKEEQQLGTQERKQTATTITTEKIKLQELVEEGPNCSMQTLSASGSTSRKSWVNSPALWGMVLLALYLPPEGITVWSVK